MIPPLSTRKLQSAIEAQRRSDADLRWEQAFGAARLTLAVASPERSPEPQVAVGRLRELLDELRDRRAAEARAEDARAAESWSNEGGGSAPPDAHRADEVSESRPASGISSGFTDSV